MSSKQALRDSSGSLKERTEEPLGNLNKVYCAHFAWPTLYSVCECTSMHEGAVNVSFSPNLTNDHELHQGVAPPGLTYLTCRWRVKQGEEDNEAQAKNNAMHFSVCLITLLLLLIICNLSNLSLYRVLSCYQA